MKRIINRITNWESWPFKIMYAPLVPVWLWYTARSGAFWFFTSSNPKLTFAGMQGEPKKEMYGLLPRNFYPTTFTVLPGDSFESILNGLKEHDISFPLIVKPEIGEQGILFRKLDDASELLEYHKLCPVEYMVQKFVEYPLEVSVFYIRHPEEEKGTVTGFLRKIPLHVIGNGKDTLRELILRHPKASRRISELKLKHGQMWHSVIPDGRKYIISHAANHNRGAQFVDLRHEIDDRLVALFDDISHSINDFYYGRYDIMCSSIEDLKQGKNFSILEYNGCGAEPNHFYDTGYSLPGAYREILKHWKALYRISNHNRSKGIEPWPFKKGRDYLRETQRHLKVIREADEVIG